MIACDVCLCVFIAVSVCVYDCVKCTLMQNSLNTLGKKYLNEKKKVWFGLNDWERERGLIIEY